ncbi:nicotinate-nucleotide--dimethylbenzimidazole phosphoribosyltransferase [Streptantibioticus silvisoli]|uniref:Nicotinate-nucleotide--dimethylbenzimidazole phosphoribosyltransferase n=1 Tax=Streptantibioticus silvisoli TaxID=2705255 RepID=A0ABT6VYE3_9ACTN|nr:nicotinate-nucleotide--dimethylbenzimidazole phosphoribosyltransferase [Streptantibioticus silvisoli]MDI5963502.1 nicotinate-nucleotide--dimethylbenzimidazole phosphoribosyltransferase [Streptantibioticus silvisoli]
MSAVDLDEFATLIERPDAGVRHDAAQRRDRTAAPATALGKLADLGDWLASVQGQVPVRPLQRPRLVLFAGDHGIAERGVSAGPAGGAVHLVRRVLEGAAPVSVLARAYGAGVRVVDVAVDCDPAELPADVTRHRVRRSSGAIDTGAALTSQEAEAAFLAGAAVADEEADSGTDLVLLGDLSVGGTTVAGVLIAALCGVDASVVTGRGSGIDDLTWMRKCAAIRDALRRARPVLGEPLELLAAVGGADVAAMTGFLLRAAVRKLPVVLDGVVASACALVAQRVAFRAPDWWMAAHVSGEPGQVKALDRLSMEALADHGVRLGEGAGALLALPLLRAAAALAAELPVAPAAEPAVEDAPQDAGAAGSPVEPPAEPGTESVAESPVELPAEDAPRDAGAGAREASSD